MIGVFEQLNCGQIGERGCWVLWERLLVTFYLVTTCIGWLSLRWLLFLNSVDGTLLMILEFEKKLKGGWNMLSLVAFWLLISEKSCLYVRSLTSDLTDAQIIRRLTLVVLPILWIFFLRHRIVGYFTYFETAFFSW